MNTRTSRYKLIDAEPRAAEHPDTFHLPTLAARTNVLVGDSVKLMFEHCDSTERMWVMVTEITPEGYEGTLSNNPITLKARLGDKVVFQAKHVIDIIVR